MPTVINNSPQRSDSAHDSSLSGLLIGLLLIVILAVLLFYGIPALRRSSGNFSNSSSSSSTTTDPYGNTTAPNTNIGSPGGSAAGSTSNATQGQ